ncbi:MAG TPA: DnaJ domain-containing protein [Smithellaceae bacterium]|nr:DnaJ domain-containing protein [Smithellaceae bacterium]
MKNVYHEVDIARKLFGLSSGATLEETKKRYRNLAKKWHPDINKSAEAKQKMQEFNEAYALLLQKEFGVLDPWDEIEKWWWQRFGNDPIWGNNFPEENAEKPARGSGRKILPVNKRGNK